MRSVPQNSPRYTPDAPTEPYYTGAETGPALAQRPELSDLAVRVGTLLSVWSAPNVGMVCDLLQRDASEVTAALAELHQGGWLR